MRGARAWLATVAVAMAASVPAGGCGVGGCDRCTGPDRAALEPAVEATVVIRGPDSDGPVGLHVGDQDIGVTVYGPAPALELGRTYLVPIAYDPATGEASASLPHRCDCGGPYITELDGSAVDTGEGVPAGLRQVAWAVMVGFALAVVAWGGLRHLRGRPLV